MTSPLRKLSATTDRSAALGLLILRVVFGVVLAMGHGLRKMSDLDGFTETVRKLGFFLPELLAPAAALSEFAGGVLMALGLITRPAAAAVLVTMLTAFVFVHANDPFAKKELALAMGAAALAVLVAGPGRFSIDAVLARPRGKAGS